MYFEEAYNPSGTGGIKGDKSFLLDEKRVVMASANAIQTGNGTEAKTMAALKSHSEAERRRRERINAHLATLRGLIPHHEKMDKATLLAEVISQVKQLKTTATQACKDLHIPMDTDEVKLEIVGYGDGGQPSLRASLCCAYRSDLVPLIRKGIDELAALRVVNCEISVLGGRVKSVFLITPQGLGEENAAAWEAVMVSVHSALSDIMRSVSASDDYDQELLYPLKRRRRVPSLDLS